MSSFSSNAPQTNTNNPSTPQSQTPSGFANYYGTTNALFTPQIPNFNPQQTQQILNTFLTQQPQQPQQQQQMFTPEQFAMHQQLMMQYTQQSQTFFPQQTQFPTQQTQTRVEETQEIVQETDDVVEETPRPSTSNPKRKKTCKKVQWTEKDEVLLAKMWCHISEDADRGNAQPEATFWKRVVAGYNKEARAQELGERGKESINSKFTAMSALVKVFIGHHAEAVRNRESGTDDATLIQAARQMYYEAEGSRFKHAAAWEIWKDHGRWRAFVKLDPPVDTVNLDDVDVGDDIFADDVQERPPGKKRGSKRKESSDVSDKAQASSSSTLCGLIATNLKKIVKTKKQTAEKKAQTLQAQEQAAIRQ